MKISNAEKMHVKALKKTILKAGVCKDIKCRKAAHESFKKNILKAGVCEDIKCREAACKT